MIERKRTPPPWHFDARLGRVVGEDGLCVISDEDSELMAAAHEMHFLLDEAFERYSLYMAAPDSRWYEAVRKLLVRLETQK